MVGGRYILSPDGGYGCLVDDRRDAVSLGVEPRFGFRVHARVSGIRFRVQGFGNVFA